MLVSETFLFFISQQLSQKRQLENGLQKVDTEQHGRDSSRKLGEIEEPGFKSSNNTLAQNTASQPQQKQEGKSSRTSGGTEAAEARRSSTSTAQGVPSRENQPQLERVIQDPDDPNFDPEAFKGVLNCRYIRGYEPPEMRVNPNEALEYVFGDKNDDGEVNQEKTLPPTEINKGKGKEVKKTKK